MFSEIILIGPFGVGKTTVGGILAEKLGLPQVSLDNVCYDYYQEIGWNGREAKRIYEQEGGDAFDEYTSSFEPYGVEQVLSRNHNCVIDLGGGHTVSENETRFARVQDALAPYQNVVLLLPFLDPEESVRVLKTRRRPDFLEYLVRSPCNYALAKHTIYTEGKSLEQVRDEVIDRTQ